LQTNESSKMLKGSGRTYFFDIQRTKDGKAYLKISESRLKGDEKLRNSIFVFPEDVKEFKRLFDEVIVNVNQ
jgi:hypothetical protein